MILPLEETLLSTVDLGILYGREKTLTKLIPIEASSSTSGFVSGHRWQPNTIRINTTTGKLMYEVSGLFEWNLPGFTLYTQPKNYSGPVRLVDK